MREQLLNKLTDINFYLPIIPFLLGIILKILLDLNLGKWFVKNFYWLSFRSIFRNKTNKFSGVYKQNWYIENNRRYKKVSDRQSLVTLKQLNKYCYGEFYAKNGHEKYYMFGEVIDRRIIGHWSSIDSKLDYFGSFELSIINSKTIEGIWIGHSNEIPTVIHQHKWTFTAVTPTHKFLVPIQLTIFIKRKYSAKKVLPKVGLT
ncbi:hypothetical protein GFO_0932 [Sporocytophaga myxococcoides]|uniref:Uncharacterized protein n=1 Tax=Sporocytophaga myxococcoides TaxID=153721 RepID=A0A098LMD6_9BACT|nr:hypothetical protein [Sporocytophaga myxococcoides]GAL87542.1 hypothetical protein GFO_0932 [Sporocytophaga myxococcoides]